jgi:hypothetical protein
MTACASAPALSWCAAVPIGRIQVYDASGQFLRGWFVPASGGAFRLAIGAGDEVEVITARRPKKLVYSLGGELRQESSDAADERGPSDGRSPLIWGFGRQ